MKGRGKQASRTQEIPLSPYRLQKCESDLSRGGEEKDQRVWKEWGEEKH